MSKSSVIFFLYHSTYSRDPNLIAQLPEGLLAIDSFWLGGVAEVMVKALNYVISATIKTLKDKSNGSDEHVPYGLYSDIKSDLEPDSEMKEDTDAVIKLRNATNFYQDFLR